MLFVKKYSNSKINKDHLSVELIGRKGKCRNLWGREEKKSC